MAGKSIACIIAGQFVVPATPVRLPKTNLAPIMFVAAVVPRESCKFIVALDDAITEPLAETDIGFADDVGVMEIF